MAIANPIAANIAAIRSAHRAAAPIRAQLAARVADTLFFEIDSFTYTNLTYDITVSADGQVEACNCPDYRFRGHIRPCKHCRALQAQINAQRAQAKQAQNEQIQKQAQATSAKRFAELEAKREIARKDHSFSLLA